VKKTRILAGILSLFIITSCSNQTDQSDSGDQIDPGIIENTDTDTDSQSSDTAPDPTDTESDSQPDSESTDVESESETEPQPTVVAPSEDTPGVYFADSFEELRDISVSDEFLSYEERAVICITDAFVFEESITIDRDVDIVYLPTTCAGGYPLNIKCRGEVGELKVSSADEMLIEGGLLTFDAPYSSLVVIGDTLPSDSAVELYCNVANYNGREVNKTYGGRGKESVAGVKLLNSSTGAAYEGVSLSYVGNLAVIQFPLVVRESDVKSAKIKFMSTDGTETDYISMDLTTASKITVPDSDGNTRTYMITSERLTYDLPVMEIHTDSSQQIVEKNTYVHGTLTIDGVSYSMKIRGRGNASWNYFPKKSYRIKLDKGASLFGLEQNRDWVLSSNYADKTMIRNCVAHSIAASLSGLEYTPTHFPVNLYLNGEYIGVYTFADKIEDGNGRIDLGGTVMADAGDEGIGFLLEIGWDFDEENVYNRDYFDTDIVVRIFIKEPEIPQANTSELWYIKQYILNMESAIVNNSGWENYIDVDSWIDWFIVNELTFNTESSFYRSCFMWRDAGGKLRLGPVWDFDMAFGNHYGDLPEYDGWCTTESTYTFISENWMNYLMTYDDFTTRLVDRWNEVKDGLLETALGAVDKYSDMLDGSQQQNFKVWNIMGVGIGMGSVSPYKYNTYEKQVQYLRDFINTRWNYIDDRLNSDEYSQDQTE